LQRSVGSSVGLLHLKAKAAAETPNAGAESSLFALLMTESPTSNSAYSLKLTYPLPDGPSGFQWVNVCGFP